ncbi:MAG: TRAP transporter small permease subunit [Burkholderiales bacterium]|nr:TRAP transporter small permease subunit [Burkholderiales bacterium]
MISSLIAALYRAIQFLLTVLMAILIVPVVLQIVSRFTAVIPRYIWTEEVARFCFIWIIMLGSMLAVRDDTHFDLEVLPTPKTPHGRAFARLIRHGAMLLVALTFVWFGYEFAVFGFEQESELSGLNMLAIHVAWPLAGVVYVLFLGEKIIQDLRIWRGRSGE